MSHSSPPPPLSSLPQQSNLIFNNNNANALHEYSPSSSSSTSIVIVTIVIASAIIISASLYLLLRFLSRRNNNNNNNNPNSIIITTPKTHTNTSSSVLPLFTFNTLPCHISGADCAVCLSKFEPHDQLRLLPLCCHAFHADCIDTWLVSNHTCPLCRSTTVYSSQTDALNKILRSDSFRIEIGSASRRRSDDSVSGEAVRSYTIGSFEYVVDEEFEVPIGDARTHRRQVSDKDSIPVEPGDDLAAEVAGDRGSWLRDYVDRIASVSFRRSGRFFGGSSRRSNAVDDLEANNRFGEEISELFQWLSGV